MHEHRAVDFLENVGSHFDLQVRCHAENVRVEGGMVEFAKRQAIRHDRLAPWMPVWENVGCIQKLLMAQSADSAAPSIRSYNTHAKPLLMHTPLDDRCDVAASSIDEGGVVGFER